MRVLKCLGRDWLNHVVLGLFPCCFQNDLYPKIGSPTWMLPKPTSGWRCLAQDPGHAGSRTLQHSPSAPAGLVGDTLGGSWVGWLANIPEGYIASWFLRGQWSWEGCRSCWSRVGPAGTIWRGSNLIINLGFFPVNLGFGGFKPVNLRIWWNYAHGKSQLIDLLLHFLKACFSNFNNCRTYSTSNSSDVGRILNILDITSMYPTGTGHAVSEDLPRSIYTTRNLKRFVILEWV